MEELAQLKQQVTKPISAFKSINVYRENKTKNRKLSTTPHC